MTLLGTQIAAALLAAGAVATAAAFGAEGGSGGAGRPAALVIDASLARDGRTLVDPKLEDVNAAVRLPRSAEEARVNVRYFDALGYRVYVAGPTASASAAQAGVPATEVDGLAGALRAGG